MWSNKPSEAMSQTAGYSAAKLKRINNEEPYLSSTKAPASLPALPMTAIPSRVRARRSVFTVQLTVSTSLQQAEALRQSILKKAFSGQLPARRTRLGIAGAHQGGAGDLLHRMQQSPLSRARRQEKSNMHKMQLLIPTMRNFHIVAVTATQAVIQDFLTTAIRSPQAVVAINATTAAISHKSRGFLT